jgi:DNA repair protein RecO (recombination protein O)
LRVVDYGEADRIVTLLTRTHGRVSAVARAARKSKRRFAGSLEGFAFISVELVFGKGALARLVSAQVTRSFPHLLGDLSRLEAAGALMRLARDVVPERVPDLSVYEALTESLEALDRPELPARPLQVAAQAYLLAVTGFAPLLSACAICGKIPREGQTALFDPARGGVVCRACGGGPERVSAIVRTRLGQAFEGRVIEAAAADWTQEQQREAERLLSRFVAHLLPQSPPLA